MTARDLTAGELLVVVQEIRQDVAEIKAQTTLTNGRVTELEIGVRVRAELEKDRQARMIADAEQLARTVEADRQRRAEKLEERSRLTRGRQWLIGTLVAVVGALGGIAGRLLSAL